MPIFEKFIEKHDETLFKIYLYIIQKSNFEFDIEKEFEYKELKQIFLKDSKATEAKQNYYIRRYLIRLADKYKLIEYVNREDTKSNIKIIIYPPLSFCASNSLSKNSPLEGCQAKPDGVFSYSFSIPQTFWQYDWYLRLDAETIFCYFINLIEAKETYKTWSKSIDKIHKQYNLRKKLISKGMNNLRYWNLIQIKYSQIQDSDYSTRRPNIYRLLPIYDIATFNESIKKLEQKYSLETVNRARTYASIVYCDYNIYEIENIIQLELEYVEKAVKRAFEIVASYKSKSDSKKSMRYIVGLLKNEQN
jgi:hypothetical protein